MRDSSGEGNDKKSSLGLGFRKQREVPTYRPTGTLFVGSVRLVVENLLQQRAVAAVRRK